MTPIKREGRAALLAISEARKLGMKRVELRQLSVGIYTALTQPIIAINWRMGWRTILAKATIRLRGSFRFYFPWNEPVQDLVRNLYSSLYNPTQRYPTIGIDQNTPVLNKGSKWMAL